MMDLGKIRINPRLRTHWEAVDLGFTLARSWYKTLFLSWVLPAATLLAILTLIFHVFEWPLWIPTVIVWWLKPLWDSSLLLYGSRALFGETLSVDYSMKGSLGFLKPDWFAWLTWRRLSPARSFVMPVTGLEGLKGEPRSRRVGLLTQRSGSSSFWITIVCLVMEVSLTAGFYALILILIPETVDFNLQTIAESESVFADMIDNFVALMASALIAPFYTMAGFALYINRRIELEAWDIEIHFRDMVSRQKSRKPRASVSKAAQLFLGGILSSLLLFATPQTTEAAPLSQLSRESAKEQITEALRGEDFHVMETKTGWRLKENPEEDSSLSEKLPEWFIDVIDWLAGLLRPAGSNGNSSSVFIIASFLELLVWAAAIGAVAWLIYHYRQGIRALFTSVDLARHKKPKVAAPEVMFGLDVRQESLPDDIPAEASALWSKGEFRAALGLLYRATLSELIHRYEFEFHPGHTERECADLVHKGQNEEQVSECLNNFVLNLTEQWQWTAYGHRQPDTKAFEHLCENWQEVFPA